MKEQVLQWLRCYKSYWYNFIIFVFSIMTSTLFLYQAVLSYFASNIGLAIVNISVVFAILVVGISHFKKFNEKNRYLIFLQIKKLLEEIDKR